MSKNLKLVRFFIEEYYRNSASEMMALASSTFSFTLNSGERMSFKRFIQGMRFLNQSTEYEIRTPRTHNDSHFYSEFTLQIPEGKSTYIEANGTVEMVIKSNLLQSVNISYHNSQAEFIAFQKLMRSSQITFL